jgi:hypothetical protein
MAPPMGAVSRVRSPLAARPPGLFDMTAQLQHGIERFGRRTVCEARGQVVPPLLKPVQQAGWNAAGVIACRLRWGRNVLG